MTGMLIYGRARWEGCGYGQMRAELAPRHGGGASEAINAQPFVGTSLE